MIKNKMQRLFQLVSQYIRVMNHSSDTGRNMLREEAPEKVYYLVTIPTRTVGLYFHTGCGSLSEVKMI